MFAVRLQRISLSCLCVGSLRTGVRTGCDIWALIHLEDTVLDMVVQSRRILWHEGWCLVCADDDTDDPEN
jgi:hypothetical protein